MNSKIKFYLNDSEIQVVFFNYNTKEALFYFKEREDPIIAEAPDIETLENWEKIYIYQVVYK